MGRLDRTERQTADFDTAKRIVLEAVEDCMDQGIDAALVSAVLIGSAVSWYSHFHGEDAVVQILSQTIQDIRDGRVRLEQTEQ